MPTPRRLIVPLVISLLVLFGTPSASWASPGHPSGTDPSSDGSVETVRETVAWTLPPNQCGSIPKGLSISGAGQRVMHTRTDVDDEDVKRTTIEDTVKGPAIDSKGREYRFVYYNLSTQVQPPTGDTIHIHMEDVFKLRPSSDESDSKDFKGFRVDFDWTWSFTVGKDMWPPEKNLVKYSTHGDPFLCDPI